MNNKIEKFLKAEGFKLNNNSAWDKDNSRVYFDDTDIIFIRFNNYQGIAWKNIIDGDMTDDQKTSLIFTMLRI